MWIKKGSTIINFELLNRMQKIGLGRIAFAYRTVPLDSLAVITGCVPWSIKLKERAALRNWETFFTNNLTAFITEHLADVGLPV